jgi:hypothetical protein
MASYQIKSRATTLAEESELPRDLFGTYLRNGPTPDCNPRGRYGIVDALEVFRGQGHVSQSLDSDRGVFCNDLKTSLGPPLISSPPPNR